VPMQSIAFAWFRSQCLTRQTLCEVRFVRFIKLVAIVPLGGKSSENRLAAVRFGDGCMTEKANPGRTMTRRDRCTRIITILSRAGRDPEIHKTSGKGPSIAGPLADAAIEDLATRVAADGVSRFLAKREREGRVIFLDLYRAQRKN
jgi:hypothetical protein